MNEQVLAEIKLAYQALSLRPVRACFYHHDDGGDWACPLVALAIFRGVVTKDDPDIRIDGGGNAALDAAIDWGWSEDGLFGFLDSFDCIENCSRNRNETYMEGLRFGELVRQELMPPEPPV